MSHEAGPSGSTAATTLDKTLEADPTTTANQLTLRPEVASTSGRALQAEELSTRKPEAAHPPGLPEAGPSSSQGNVTSQLQNDLQLDQPSSSGACQGI